MGECFRTCRGVGTASQSASCTCTPAFYHGYADGNPTRPNHPRNCHHRWLAARSFKDQARAEVMAPKLRARRVGRELASCESDLPVW